MAFLVIYSQGLTFQFISFFPELLTGSALSVWLVSLGILKRSRGLGRKYLLGRRVWQEMHLSLGYRQTRWL